MSITVPSNQGLRIDPEFVFGLELYRNPKAVQERKTIVDQWLFPQQPKPSSVSSGSNSDLSPSKLSELLYGGKSNLVDGDKTSKTGDDDFEQENIEEEVLSDDSSDNDSVPEIYSQPPLTAKQLSHYLERPYHVDQVFAVVASPNFKFNPDNPKHRKLLFDKFQQYPQAFSQYVDILLSLSLMTSDKLEKVEINFTENDGRTDQQREIVKEGLKAAAQIFKNREYLWEFVNHCPGILLHLAAESRGILTLKHPKIAISLKEKRLSTDIAESEIVKKYEGSWRYLKWKADFDSTSVQFPLRQFDIDNLVFWKESKENALFCAEHVGQQHLYSIFNPENRSENPESVYWWLEYFWNDLANWRVKNLLLNLGDSSFINIVSNSNSNFLRELLPSQRRAVLHVQKALYEFSKDDLRSYWEFPYQLHFTKTYSQLCQALYQNNIARFRGLMDRIPLELPEHMFPKADFLEMHRDWLTAKQIIHALAVMWPREREWYLSSNKRNEDGLTPIQQINQFIDSVIKSEDALDLALQESLSEILSDQIVLNYLKKDPKGLFYKFQHSQDDEDSVHDSEDDDKNVVQNVEDNRHPFHDILLKKLSNNSRVFHAVTKNFRDLDDMTTRPSSLVSPFKRFCYDHFNFFSSAYKKSFMLSLLASSNKKDFLKERVFSDELDPENKGFYSRIIHHPDYWQYVEDYVKGSLWKRFFESQTKKDERYEEVARISPYFRLKLAEGRLKKHTLAAAYVAMNPEERGKLFSSTATDEWSPADCVVWKQIVDSACPQDLLGLLKIMPEEQCKSLLEKLLAMPDNQSSLRELARFLIKPGQLGASNDLLMAIGNFGEPDFINHRLFIRALLREDQSVEHKDGEIAKFLESFLTTVINETSDAVINSFDKQDLKALHQFAPDAMGYLLTRLMRIGRDNMARWLSSELERQRTENPKTATATNSVGLFGRSEENQRNKNESDEQKEPVKILCNVM